MSSIFGGQAQANPVAPIVGYGTQTNFFNALFGLGLQPNTQGGGMMFRPQQGYGGQLSPDMNNTILPNVYSSWSPQNFGTGYLDYALKSNLAGVGQAPQPYADIASGNLQGPGAGAMTTMRNSGGPSPYINQMTKDLALYGSPGLAGQPLSNIAQGFASGPAAYLAPFLLPGGGKPSFYSAPSIPGAV